MPATKRKMDFTNVKDGGNFRPKRRPEGDYLAKVVKVEDSTSNAGNEQWVFTIMVKGDQRSTYPYYCGIDEKQAWKVRKMFIAAGIQVPKKMVLVDPNKLVGKEVGIVLVDDEYEGRMKSVIDEFIPVDDVTGEGDDDDADEVEEDEVEEVEEAPPARKRTAAKKTTRRRAPEPEEEDEEEDEEVEEELAPRRRAAKKAPAKKAAARRRAPEPEDDEDEDVDDLDLEEL
jgi:hypothetical protein